MNLFDAEDYKSYIRDKVKENGAKRGYHSALSRAAGCKSSYLSLVLNGSAHLTLDHAAGLCVFWEFTDLETEYYFALINHNRASTNILAERTKKQLNALRKRKLSLSQQIDSKSLVGSEHVVRYYSAWFFSAIHMLVGIPSYSRPEPIAKRLKMPTDKVIETLEFLQEMNLVKLSNSGQWQRLESDLHLPDDSIHMSTGHASWRLQSIDRFQLNPKNGLFYSGIHTLSVTDIDIIKSIFLNALEKSRCVVSPSPEEEAICIICDIFPL